MERPIRILHVLGRLNRGGAETMVMNLYRNIDRSKVQFDFIIHTNEKCDYSEEVLSLGGIIYSVPRFVGTNYVQYSRAWKRFFKDHPEYKIIHGHVRSTASIYLWIAKRKGLITIAHSHNTSSGIGLSAAFKNLLQYPIRHIADFLFACSLSGGQWLYGRKVTNSKKFIILKNAIETNNFIFNQNVRYKIRKQLQIENKFVIGHIGRFNIQKNHQLIVDIFSSVYSKNKNAVLLLVGDGELRPEIEKRVNDLGINKSVIFMGVRTDIPEILQAMDCFLFPSLFEGLGIVVIEAQAAGLPCFVSPAVPDEAFITDLIQMLPFTNTPNQWAENILSYFNIQKQRREMTKEISEAGYDIYCTAPWIQNFYLKNCGE